MGGRSGQRLATNKTAAAEVPDKTVKVVGGGISDAMQQAIQLAVRRQGATGDIVVKIDTRGKSPGGAVGWSKKDSEGRRTILPEITIYARGLNDSQILEVAKHESQHIKQSQSGRFYDKDRFIYWEGQAYISQRAYSGIIRGFNSISAAVRKRSYQQYRALPWEVEAHAAGDPFKISI